MAKSGTQRLLTRRFIRVMLMTLGISLLPIFILMVIANLAHYKIADEYPAADRLCENIEDIYVEDYIKSGGGAMVIDQDRNVIDLGGKSMKQEGSLTSEEMAELFNEMADDSGSFYDIAYYDGAAPYWLILRQPVSFLISINIDSDSAYFGRDFTIVQLIFILYLMVLTAFAVAYSVKTAKEVERIEKEEENKRMLLVSEISHDLKTPLASVQGYSEMLLNNKVEEKDKEDYLHLIYDNSVRINEMLQSLFMYSKLGSAGYEINKEKSDICEFIRLIAAEYITRFEQDGFEYAFDIPDREIYVDIDKNLMRRVFDNLIENSVKYNREGTKIEISVVPAKDIEITVSDNGCGIPEDDKDMIWKPFYRIDNTSQGSGLGLAIVKQIVELHEGRIELVPSDKGCKWNIFLRRI